MSINIDKRRSYVSIFLAIVLTKVVFFKRMGIAGTYGIEFCLFALMLMVFIYYTISRCKERSRLENVGCIFLGIVFGLLNVSGIYMYYEKRIPLSYRNALVMVILLSGYSLLFYFISCWVFILLRWLTRSIELKSINEYKANYLYGLIKNLSDPHFDCSEDWFIRNNIFNYENTSEDENFKYYISFVFSFFIYF